MACARIYGPADPRLPGEIPQWDPSQFAQQTQLTDLEARLAPTKAGYEAGQDGLWRLSSSVEGSERHKVMEEIEKRAEANIEAGWSDDFPIDQDESPSADGGPPRLSGAPADSRRETAARNRR
jgi:hypothetical protein